jgi:hypothetical protein
VLLKEAGDPHAPCCLPDLQQRSPASNTLISWLCKLTDAAAGGVRIMVLHLVRSTTMHEEAEAGVISIDRTILG